MSRRGHGRNDSTLGVHLVLVPLAALGVVLLLWPHRVRSVLVRSRWRWYPAWMPLRKWMIERDAKIVSIINSPSYLIRLRFCGFMCLFFALFTYWYLMPLRRSSPLAIGGLTPSPPDRQERLKTRSFFGAPYVGYIGLPIERRGEWVNGWQNR